MQSPGTGREAEYMQFTEAMRESGFRWKESKQLNVGTLKEKFCLTLQMLGTKETKWILFDGDRRPVVNENVISQEVGLKIKCSFIDKRIHILRHEKNSEYQEFAVSFYLQWLNVCLYRQLTQCPIQPAKIMAQAVPAPDTTPRYHGLSWPGVLPVPSRVWLGK